MSCYLPPLPFNEPCYPGPCGPYFDACGPVCEPCGPPCPPPIVCGPVNNCKAVFGSLYLISNGSPLNIASNAAVPFTGASCNQGVTYLQGGYLQVFYNGNYEIEFSLTTPDSQVQFGVSVCGGTPALSYSNQVIMQSPGTTLNGKVVLYLTAGQSIQLVNTSLNTATLNAGISGTAIGYLTLVKLQ